jgi:hypothetical protein
VQQSHRALQLCVESLQMLPDGAHPAAALQTPMVAPAAIEQVTGCPEPPGSPADPQQSLSAVQVSPAGWQPLGCRQTGTPVGPYGAHRWLQHMPPHVGTPPLGKGPTHVQPKQGLIVHWQNSPPQSIPSTWQAALRGGAGAHVPSFAPAATLHALLQQSDAATHTSPGWPQYDGTEQRPFWHHSEQQSPLCMHALPRVLHAVLSGVHVPPAQAPPQHWPSEAHG